MTRRIHRLTLPLSFPSGIAPGEGSDYNLLTIARNGPDGEGQPVLRGTALAGALRHAWKKHEQNGGRSKEDILAEERHFFGYALDQDAQSGNASSLQVGDCVLDIGGQVVVQRTHHWRNRHTGVVVDGGLFSMEACPPGTSTVVTLWLNDRDESAKRATSFLQTLVVLLGNGLTLGGNAARGIGVAELNPADTRYRIYELSAPKDFAAYLDDHRAWRSEPQKTLSGEPLKLPSADKSEKDLEVTFQLEIPRGQDILVGDGQGIDHEIEPQRVLAADGKEYWRLPGATLRGLFRGWFARLAAREGQPVSDSAQRYAEGHGGWRAELVSDEEIAKCPVCNLFGSTQRSGRIQVSDSYAACTAKQDDGSYAEEQLRKHVAVDRITGGAAESMLFENTVLTALSDGSSPRFQVTMRVIGAEEHEAKWLAQALRALDLGVLRVGSSKSSGRMSVVKPVQATGRGHENFDTILREEKANQ